MTSDDHMAIGCSRLVSPILIQQSRLSRLVDVFDGKIRKGPDSLPCMGASSSFVFATWFLH